MTGEKVDDARKRLKASLDDGKSMLDRVEDEIICNARAAMECLRENPRVSVVSAVAVGAFIGCFVAFGCHHRGR
jgi:ElaB/YqjD/DUF883 family membrane-anchored ribosome-binding protein